MDSADVSALLNALEAALPEALPQRYGLYEPPQHLYAETGRAHFEEFLNRNLHDTVVWYARPPVAHIGLSIPERIGGSRLGFRAARVTVQRKSAGARRASRMIDRDRSGRGLA